MKKILIIGAGFLQRFVIKRAKEMGYYVLTVDGSNDAPGFNDADEFEVINIVDKDACLEYARRKDIDGVMTAATDFGVLTAAYIAEKMNLPGNSYKTAELVKNKYLVKKCFCDNQVDDTDQVYEVDVNTDIDDLKRKIKYPVMVKPCDGSGSRGTSRVDSPEELNEACQYAMNGSITHRAEIETFVFGKEYGIESIVVNGEVHVLGVMKKWMTNPPFYAELGHAYPPLLPKEIEEKAILCAKRAIEIIGITSGAVNMDALITDDGKVYIVDVGARMGGNMIGPCVIPYGTGVDYVAALINTALGEPVSFEESGATPVATKLLAFEEGTIKKIPNIEQVEKEFDVEIYHHMEAGQQVNKYRTNLDGVGYIVAKADSVEEAESKAAKALEYFKEYLFEK